MSDLGWGDNNAARKEDRLYGCARFGCNRINDPTWSYGALGKSWCLHHRPRWWERFLLRLAPSDQEERLKEYRDTEFPPKSRWLKCDHADFHREGAFNVCDDCGARTKPERAEP